MQTEESALFYNFAHAPSNKVAMKKAKELVKLEDSCVEIVRHIRTVSLPWGFLGQLDDGIEVILDRLLYRHRTKLSGVPIARSQHKIKQKHAPAIEDHPQVHFPVRCKFAVFRPHVGAKVPAGVVRVDEGQVVCSIYGVITANVWRHHAIRKSKRKIDVNVGDRVILKVRKIRLHGRYLQLDAKLHSKCSDT